MIEDTWVPVKKHISLIENRWIPVTENMPEENQEVAYLMKGGSTGTVTYDWSFQGRFADNVTHWFPLPNKEEI